MRAEVENNLILGIASALARNPPRTQEPPYLSTVELNGNVVTCGLRAPPNKLALTRSDQPGAMRVLAADALSFYPTLATVVGPEPDVEDFGTSWADLTGAAVQRGVRQRIYETREVQQLQNPPPGTLRPASPSDLSFVIPWIAAFFDEIPGVQKSDPAELARERLKRQPLSVGRRRACIDGCVERKDSKRGSGQSRLHASRASLSRPRYGMRFGAYRAASCSWE